ncbi:flagellar protein [Bacillus sp. ISL-18]|uniref:flagellar protein n=1 Tax=Bacillus sp. ISL-18 TaxID=2819118 RepID=UPI001BE59F6E|nr:flagellar protein [Bacillus sp. ISL-18]MBT2657800.1 flagellar protein [Bacillus sp. ISL-18]
MVLPKMGNCPKCKKLFLQLRDICDDCYQKQETDFLNVNDFLRRNKGCTIQELSEATKVSIGQIRQFILSGRLLLVQFPNISYPCEICGNMIRTGKACSSCTETVNKLNKQVNKTPEPEIKKSYLRVKSQKI